VFRKNLGASHLQPVVARKPECNDSRAIHATEEAFLLDVLRVHFGDSNKVAPPCRSVSDWDWVVDQSHKHSIFPLVQSGLSNADVDHVPVHILEEIRQRSRAISMYTLHQTRELIRVVQYLESVGIPVMSLKGPLMGPLAYGHLTHRYSLDLDLLVRPSHFWEARSILRTLGYEPRRNLTEAERTRFVKWHLSDDLFNSDKGVQVELHSAFFKSIISRILNMMSVWERHEMISYAGANFRRLALEDQIIYLCAHGAQHRWEKLKWICDVAGVISRHSNIDWSTVEHRAKRSGSYRMVELGLCLAHQLLGIPYPNLFRRPDFPSDTSEQLANTVISRWLFAAADADTDPVQEFWFHFREREHWRDRIPYVLHSAQLAVTPTEKDRAFLALPQSLDWVYYLVRPVRLTRDYLIPAMRKTLVV